MAIFSGARGIPLLAKKSPKQMPIAGRRWLDFPGLKPDLPIAAAIHMGFFNGTKEASKKP